MLRGSYATWRGQTHKLCLKETTWSAKHNPRTLQISAGLTNIFILDSIVNGTLKNGIFISKESDSFEYISFFKVSFIHQKLRVGENLLYLGKYRETSPKSHRIWTKITPSHSAYQRTLLRSFKLLSTKMRNFVFFAKRPITGACSLFFFPGVIVSTQWS